MAPEQYFSHNRDIQNDRSLAGRSEGEYSKEVKFLPSSQDEITYFSVLFLIFISCCLGPLFSMAVGACRRNEPILVENGKVQIREVFSVDHVGNSYLVDINTANVYELCVLPGIGRITAEKIVAEREVNGPYRSIEDLARVNGIGKRKVEAIAEMIAPITVPESVAER